MAGFSVKFSNNLDAYHIAISWPLLKYDRFYLSIYRCSLDKVMVSLPASQTISTIWPILKPVSCSHLPLRLRMGRGTKYLPEGRPYVLLHTVRRLIHIACFTCCGVCVCIKNCLFFIAKQYYQHAVTYCAALYFIVCEPVFYLRIIYIMWRE
jgi:hypothetical protein